jgi:hypothetical protein
MSIEVNRKDSKYTYRINPYNPRIIDCRVNRHGARWMWYGIRNTPEEARAYLLQLEKEAKEKGNANGA